MQTDPAEAILTELRSLGVLVSIEGSALRVRAPKGVFSERLQREFRRHKDRIQALVDGQAVTQEDGAPAAHQGPTPLTPWQRGFWLMHRRADADLGVLNNSVQLALKGRVDAERLRAAWRKVFARHDILRARFHAQPDGSALQQAGSDIRDLDVEPVNGRDALEAAGRSALARFVARRFDLENEPPVRACLLVTPEESRLVVCAHHIAADGWAFGVLLRELFAFYDDPLAPLPAPASYLGLAARMAGQWVSPRFRARIEEEAVRFAGLPACHGLPADQRRGEQQDVPGGSVAFRVSVETKRRLEAAARRAGTTLHATLIAALAALHRRLTGENRLSIMSPVANRNAGTELEGIVGPFANAVVVAASLANATTFNDALRAVAADLDHLYERQDVPFDDALDLAATPRLPGTYPLAQIVLALQDAGEKPACATLDIDIRSLTEFGRQDLFIEFRNSGDAGLDGRINFDGRLFDRATVEAFAAAFMDVISEAGNDPDICGPVAVVPQPRGDENPGRGVAHRLAGALGLVAGNTVRLETPCDEALAHLLLLAGMEIVTHETAPADLLLSARPRPGAPHRRVVAFNHIVDGMPALLTAPDLGPVAFLSDVPRETAFAAAVALRDDLVVRAHDGNALPPGLPGFLSLSGARPQAKRDRGGTLLIRTDILGAACAWISGHLVDLDACAADLLHRLRLADTALSVENRGDGPALVAWVCPTGPGDYDALANAVRSALADRATIDHVVRLSSLPRTVDGVLDRHRLSLMPINAPSIVTPLLDGHRNAARTKSAPKTQAIVHLSQLLPDDAGETITALPRYSSAGGGRDHRTAGAGDRPALLEGPALWQSYPASGWSPLEWLRDAPDRTRTLRSLDHDGRETSISFAMLLERAARISAGLRQAGVANGDTVVIAPRRPADFLAAFLGTMQAGVTAAPVPPPRRWEAGEANFDRLIHVARLSQARHVIVNEPVGEAIPGLTVLQADDLARNAPDVAIHAWAREETILVSFTSGSTGRPKGVPLHAGNVWAQPLSFGPALGFQPGETALNLTSLDHVASLVGFCGSALTSGCDLALISVERFLGAPDDVVDRLCSWRAARSWAPDFALGIIAGIIGKRPAGSLDLSALRALYSAGECPLDATFARFDHALKKHRAGAELRTSWGMAETTSLLTLSRAWNGADAHARASGVIDSGAPIAGNAARIVDAGGQLLQEGEVGLFEARGTQVFRGYIILEDDGSIGFRSPLDDDGWMATGDLAYIQDGRIVFLGREKDVLILNGQNVAQAAIEDTVNALDGVDPSFTAAFASRRIDTGESSLIVLFCPLTGVSDRPALIRKVSGAIASTYGVQPDHVLPVTRGDIPKTGLGKIQRIRLRDAFEAGHYADLMRETDLSLRNARTLPAISARWGERHILPCPIPSTVLLLDDESGLSLAVERILQARGAITLRVAAGAAASAAAHLKHGGTIVDFCPPAGSEDAAGEIMRRLTLVKALAPLSERTLRFLWIERGTQASRAGAALSACLRHEFRHIVSQCVAVQSLVGTDDLADLANLLLTPVGGHVSRLTLRENGEIAAPRLLPVRNRPFPAIHPLPAAATVLVPGGHGEIGRIVIEQLLAWTDWRFIVVGRRTSEAAGFSARERVDYLQADAGDTNSLRAALQGRDVDGVINLTGHVARTPLATLDTPALQAGIAARLRVVDALDAMFQGGRILHITSVNADFGRHDFLGYSIANAMQQERIAALAPRHVDVPCGQWEAAGGRTGVNLYLAPLGYPVIDARNGAAAIIRAFLSDGFEECLGLDLQGSELAAFADRRQPLDVVEITGSMDPATLDALRRKTGTQRTTIVTAEVGAGGGNTLNATEAQIRTIWGQVLDAKTDISPDANFFDIGGTSLLAARLLLGLQEALGGPADVLALFSNSTIRAQARLLSRSPVSEKTTQAPDIAKERPPRRIPAGSMAQRRRAAIAELGEAKD